MGAVNQAVQAVSDTVSHVGKVVSQSPIAQAATTAVGVAAAPFTGGASIPITAAVLGANQASQTGDIGQGITTGALSYLGGTGADNLLTTGSLLGSSGAASSGAAASGGSSGMFGGWADGLTGGTIGDLNIGGFGTPDTMFDIPGLITETPDVMTNSMFSGSPGLWDSIKNFGVNLGGTVKDVGGNIVKGLPLS